MRRCVARSLHRSRLPAATRVAHVGRRGMAKKAKAAKENSITVDLSNAFEYHRLPAGTLPSSVTVSRDELVDMYTDMYRMRRLEVVTDQLYKSRMIRGFCHLYNGQEAVVMGMQAALGKTGHHVITAYRDHCFQLARGGTSLEVLAELLGREAGCSGGKGGSMHMYTKEGKFYGGNGIVGAQVPIGAGIAFAQKYQNTGEACFAFYGDGASNQGQVFEAYNMAAIWKLPCVFVCENNHYGMGTGTVRATAAPNMYSRGDFVPGLKADGMDVLATREAFRFAAKYALEHGPLVMEVETYRYVGHSMSDAGSYRTREEVQEVRAQRDPIEKVKRWLLTNSLVTEAEIKSIDKSVREELNEAVEQAKASPEPSLDAKWTNVYDVLVPTRDVELDTSFVPQ